MSSKVSDLPIFVVVGDIRLHSKPATEMSTSSTAGRELVRSVGLGAPKGRPEPTAQGAQGVRPLGLVLSLNMIAAIILSSVDTSSPLV